MDDSLMIDVAGLRMYGRPGHSPFVVVEDGLEGWDDGVDMRSERVNRAQAHGAYSMPGFLDSRVVSVNGVILAKGARELQAARNRLTGLLANGQSGRVQVTQAGQAQWADGFLSSKPKVNRRRGTYNADFQIQFWFPDPRKFGDANVYTLSPGQTLPLFQYGNTDASPIFDITGDMPAGYTLRGPDSKTFVAPTAVNAERPHHLDMSEGLLKVRGYYWTGQTGNADLWTIPPGQQVNTGFTATGTGTAKVTVYDTYI